MRATRSPWVRETARVVEAFERATGLAVCIRSLAGAWTDERGRGIIPRGKALHRRPFCERVKHDHLERCKRDDLHVLPQVCRPGRDPFIRRCHAGADEVLIPLHRRDQLLGVIFAGQFRRRGTQPRDLPRWTPPQCAHVLALALPLRAYFLALLERLEERRRHHADSRAARIESFLRTHLSTDPALADLAAHLSLSPSRTGHLVAELMGGSLRHVKARLRLEVARQLLARSDAKIAWVAAQAGFSDPAYFSRYFARRVGLTPVAYRRRFGAAPGV